MQRTDHDTRLDTTHSDVPLHGEAGDWLACTRAKAPQSQLTPIDGYSLVITQPRCAQEFLHRESKKLLGSFFHLNSVGTQKGGGTNRGHHLVSTFVPARTQAQDPSGDCMFMDLSEAFDKMVRQVVFGVGEARAKHRRDHSHSREKWSGRRCCVSPSTHHCVQWWFATSAQSSCTHLQHGWPAA